MLFVPKLLIFGLKIFENCPLTKYCPPDGDAKFKLIGGDPRQNSSIKGK